MKTLSLRQPWASLVLGGWKDVENRGWSTSFRGRIAIHAALAPAPTKERYHADVLGELGHHSLATPLSELPRGVILGTVELVDICIGYDSPWTMDTTFQWLLANPERFDEPVPATGRLGLWEWNG